MYEKLKDKAKELIEKYEKEENEKRLQKLYVINKLLENNNLFLEIPMEVALNILQDLEIENYEDEYIALILPNKQ